MNRRLFLKGLGLAGLAGAGLTGCDYLPEMGLMNPCLAGLPDEIQQHPLMQTIWQQLDPAKVWDSHTHLVGIGDSDSGIWFNPKMDSWRHPLLNVQKTFYMNGACADPARVDQSVVERLVEMSRDMPAGYKSMLFAFDWTRDEHGKIQKDHAIFHIPNAYARDVANAHREHFAWVCSIHPYREDAVDALAQAHADGAKAIKWLPSAMGIDPASPKCDAFYAKAAALNIPIICHSGEEKAVQGGNQAYGNPLRLRRALEHGVKVSMAHCASAGEDEDEDNNHAKIRSFDLFARMMDNPKYEGLLVGEISAVSLVNHAWVLPELLSRTEWHPRLINGSDYPLPGIYPFINTKQLVKQGLISEQSLSFLQGIKPYNALLYNFALKRLMHYQGKRFSDTVFESRRFFEPA